MIPSRPSGLMALDGKGGGNPTTSHTIPPQLKDAGQDRVFHWVRLQVDAIRHELKAEGEGATCQFILHLLHPNPEVNVLRAAERHKWGPTYLHRVFPAALPDPTGSNELGQIGRT